MTLRAPLWGAAGITVLLAATTSCSGGDATDANLPSGGASGAAPSGGAAVGGGVSVGGIAASGTSAASGANGAGKGGSSGAAGQASDGVGHGQVILAHQRGTPGLVELRTTFGYGPPSDCPTIATHGDCRVIRCEPNDPTTASTLSAGTVSATSTPVALQLLAAPDAQKADGYPRPQQSLMGDFKGVEVVTFATTGGEVPQFSQGLPMFAPVVLTKPDSTETSIPIPYSGVDLEWQGGEAGSTVAVVAFGGGEAFTLLRCTWDAAAGAGSLPPEALKLLPNGKELSINVRRDAVHNAGNFAIELALVSGVRNVRDTGGRLLVLDDSL